ncbi:MAG: TonB-dependent receptor, partial [Acidobacteriota bacterium]
YQDVLVLAPGVQDEDQDGNVNILGSRDRDVLTTVDGVDVTDPFSGKDPMSFNLEAIAEIELVRAGAGAQYGGKSGGFINLITKSGSNEFGGAFKIFLRGDLLDGDGAGSDPPEFHGGDDSTQHLRDVKFQEFRPFLSIGGPIIRDRLWYYIASEYLSIETPVNTVNRAFATSFEGFREFAKLTWQASVENKLDLVYVYDPFSQGNLGVDSTALVEAGFTRERRRSSWTLRDFWIASPRVLLESTVSFVDYGFDDTPTTNPDRSGNGVFYRRPALADREDPDCTEADPSRCDSVLDRNHDGYITDLEDPDGFFPARWRDPGEDFNADGELNGNICLPAGFGGQRFCEGDHNGDSFAAPRDIDFRHELIFNEKSGPYFLSSTDDRKRLAFSEVLSLEMDYFGSHSIDLGGTVVREDYRTDIERRTVLVAEMNNGCQFAETQKDNFFALANILASAVCEVTAEVPLPRIARDLEAGADRLGLFINNRYKPRSNLTLGIGFRFDREKINASGFQPFDPQAERALYDHIQKLAGNSGLIRGDPLLLPGVADSIGISLVGAAVREFTVHENPPAFDLPPFFVDTRNQFTDALDPTPRVPESYTIENNNLSPRLSVAWDPKGNGRTKIFSTWGRYYDNIFLEAVVQEEAPATVSRSYTYDYDGLNDVVFDRCDPTQGLCEYHGIFEEGQRGSFAPPSVRQVRRDLASPHADEFTIGFEREIAPEMVIGVTYIRRKWEDQLQDIDVNHQNQGHDILGSLERVKLPDSDNTCGGELLFTPDPDGFCRTKAVISDGFPDLKIHNFFFNQILQIGNYNSSDYEGIEFTFRRRLHRKWQMEASYT